MWTYPDKSVDLLTLNTFFVENFIFCVVNIIGFNTQSCKCFFKRNCQSVIYFTSINIWHRLVSSLLFRKQFLAWWYGLDISAQELLHDNILLEHRTFFKLPLVEEVSGKLLVNCLPKQLLDTVTRGILFIVKGDFLLVKQDM